MICNNKNSWTASNIRLNNLDMTSKISTRFYKDLKVRVVWDEVRNQWWFSVLDILEAINLQEDHEKNRNH